MQLKQFLRQGYSQVLVIGFVTFCCPGFFNALVAMGGAGSRDPTAAAASNALLYLMFAIMGYMSGAAFNMFGPRVLLSIGGSTYAIYCACAYLSVAVPQLNWLFVLSGAILGIGAALLWTGSSVVVSYAPDGKRGKYIATFWGIFNIGGMLGGFIQFAMNFNQDRSADAASAASYFTFVGVMILGSVVAALFVVSPSEVIKEDGTQVEVEKPKTPKEELRDVLSVITDKNMLLLTVLFFGSNFFYPYMFDGVNGFTFTTRTRGLNSALYWAFQTLGSIVLGWILDNEKRESAKRAITGLVVLVVVVNVAYALGCYFEYGILAGYNKDHPLSETEQFDFTEARFVYPLIVFILYGFGDSMIQSYAYWIMGAISKNDTILCARYVGFYKSVQSLGAAVSWVIDIKQCHVPYIFQFWVCWVLFLAAIPPTYLACRRLSVLDAQEAKQADNASSTHESVVGH